MSADASSLRSVFLACALLLASAGAAEAQSGDKAMAESLFQAGRTLMKEGKAAEACPKFAESNRIDPSPGTLLNLGKCLEAQGKTASAWSAYKEAVVLARSTGQTKHVTAGSEFAAAIEPKLSRLRIDAPTRASGQIIKRDGLVIGDGALGVPIAVDPGEHVIEATAPGHAPWSTTIKIGAQADQKSVEVPALEPAPEDAAVAPGPTGAPTETTPPEPDKPPPAPGSSTLRTLGFVSLGVAAVGIGVGAVFGVMTLGDASDAESDPALCPAKRCSTEGLDKIDAAETKALVSTIGFAVGGAAAIGGVVMLVASRGKSAPAQGSAAPRVAGVAGPRGGGLTLTGSF